MVAAVFILAGYRKNGAVDDTKWSSKARPANHRGAELKVVLMAAPDAGLRHVAGVAAVALKYYLLARRLPATV